MIFVASRPSRLGILISIRIRSGFASSYEVTASIPSRARISLYFLPRIAFSKSKLLSSSSAIRIVRWLGEALAEILPELSSSVLPEVFFGILLDRRFCWRLRRSRVNLHRTRAGRIFICIPFLPFFLLRIFGSIVPTRKAG